MAPGSSSDGSFAGSRSRGGVSARGNPGSPGAIPDQEMPRLRLAIFPFASALALALAFALAMSSGARAGSVPEVDLDRHEVPLAEIYFDTFDGGRLPRRGHRQSLGRRGPGGGRPAGRPQPPPACEPLHVLVRPRRCVSRGEPVRAAVVGARSGRRSGREGGRRWTGLRRGRRYGAVGDGAERQTHDSGPLLDRNGLTGLVRRPLRASCGQRKIVSLDTCPGILCS